MPNFDDIDVEWLRSHGVARPEEVFADLEKWRLGTHSKEMNQRKILSALSGLTMGAVAHYTHGRQFNLGQNTIARLDDIAIRAGITPPERTNALPRRKAVNKKPWSNRNIALALELRSIPSGSFHLSMLASVLEASIHHNLPIAVHEVSRLNLAEDLDRILRRGRIDGIILLRLSPDEAAIRALKKWRTPAVLIHGHRLQYPFPAVIANVVPNLEQLTPWMSLWAAGALPGSVKIESSAERPIVVVSAPEEPKLIDFEPLEPKEDWSIRNTRRRKVVQAVAGMHAVVEELPDYSFRHAASLLKKHPNASAWICLSDEVAVALKQILTALAPNQMPRIVGYDDSALAKLERLSSIGQRVEDSGMEATRALSDWIQAEHEQRRAWSELKEIRLDLSLQMRD